MTDDGDIPEECRNCEHSPVHGVGPAGAVIGEMALRLKNAQIQCRLYEAQKDAAYVERNRCVAALAACALRLGFAAGLRQTAIQNWEPQWHNAVYIDLPAGQVSWHYHDSERPLFAFLPEYLDEWDGHDTPEKYRRVLELTKA